MTRTNQDYAKLGRTPDALVETHRAPAETRNPLAAYAHRRLLDALNHIYEAADLPLPEDTP